MQEAELDADWGGWRAGPIHRSFAFISCTKGLFVMMSSESVSVLLSVENAQSWLAGDLNSMVDCLADLSSAFEIIVIDNGSRDFTIEVIEDMCARFPQIRYRRFAEKQSLDKSMATAMDMAQGDYIFTAEAGGRIYANDLRRLWALRSDPRLVVARSHTTARRIDAGLINRLTQWAQKLTAQNEPQEASVESFGGLQMMRKDAMAKLQPAKAAKNNANIEISHVSHQQLASPKLVEARRMSESVKI